MSGTKSGGAGFLLLRVAIRSDMASPRIRPFSGVSWNRDLIWEILDGISNASRMCIRHVAVDTLIEFNSQVDVPCIGASRRPGETIFLVFHGPEL